LVTEINNYKIIKRSKLKVSFDKSWWKNINEILCACVLGRERRRGQEEA
jgi:hypothetical protein